MNALTKFYCLFRCLGPRLLWLRARVQLDDALGVTRRRFPHRRWEDIDLQGVAQFGAPANPESYARFKKKQARPFLFPFGAAPKIPESIRSASSRRQPALAERLELLREDRCVYFFRTPSPSPIDWHANPFEGTRAPAERVWCDIPDFDPSQGDARTLWEPSRAAWAFDLARAAAHEQDVAAGEIFWRWVDSWMAANPPFLGFQWKSGQEVAVRFIALYFGLWSLASDPATTAERWPQLAKLAWASGYRIRQHIRYAVAQKNNHALSEACGLFLIGHLFPEFRDAAEWERTGRRILAGEIVRQVYADGSYVQHSMNYHRVMMQVALIAVRLAELAGKPFNPEVYESLSRAEEFLFQMIEPLSGAAPNHGNNDGALLLPLNECDFTDYRPVVQAVHYLIHKKRRLEAGPWDEDLLWLFGREALDAPVSQHSRPVSRGFRDGGYYTLRGRRSWGMVRCHTYRDRPAHCDHLHFDLWLNGVNVLQDAGTFRYYVSDRPDVERFFKSTRAHNTVEVDGRDPLTLVSRFLWLPWPGGRLLAHDKGADAAPCVELERWDYDRRPWRVLHRRAVVTLGEDVWLVVDDLLGRGSHRAALSWHAMDRPYQVDRKRQSVTLERRGRPVQILVASEPSGCTRFDVVRAQDAEGAVQGFVAPYYNERRPAPTVVVEFDAPLPLRILTLAAPAREASLAQDVASDGGQSWTVRADDHFWTVELARPDRAAARMLLNVARHSARA